MPSPIAHSISGYAISQLLPLDEKTAWWRKKGFIYFFYIILVANAADLDFILQILLGENYHHGLTHSLTFAFGFTLIILIIGYFMEKRLSNRLAFLTLILYGSHIFLDFFSEMGKGIQLLWPFTDKYFNTVAVIFPGVHYSKGLFNHSHIKFISFELGYSVVLLGGLWFWRTKKAVKNKYYVKNS